MKIEGLAGRGRRLAATLVDAVLVPSLTIILVMLTDVVEDAEDFADNWWMLDVLLLAIASYLLLNGRLLLKRGQTIGKWLLGIAITQSNTDKPASFWNLVLLRAWFFPLLFLALIPPLTLLPLADLLMIFTKQRRCGHDWLCRTQVVRVSAPNQSTDKS